VTGYLRLNCPCTTTSRWLTPCLWWTLRSRSPAESEGNTAEHNGVRRHRARAPLPAHGFQRRAVANPVTEAEERSQVRAVAPLCQWPRCVHGIFASITALRRCRLTTTAAVWSFIHQRHRGTLPLPSTATASNDLYLLCPSDSTSRPSPRCAPLHWHGPADDAREHAGVAGAVQ
jgi:hypothetical protein